MQRPDDVEPRTDRSHARPVTRRAVLGSSFVVGAALLAGCGSDAARSDTTRSDTTRSSAGSASPARSRPTSSPVEEVPGIDALEQRFSRRIGVAALDVRSGRRLAHRGDERFLHCSTGKVVTVAAVLHAAQGDRGVLSRVVRYRPGQVVAHSPVTSLHLDGGMTVRQLCAAALTVSDNTAENLLLSQVGGPGGVTAYVRTLGDRVTRLDRTETALNERTPEGLDTTTPAAMLSDLHALALGSALPDDLRSQLITWMRGCTTGDHQIRAGSPAGWTVADKTGSGDHGESNDIAVLRRPDRTAVVLTVYTDTTDGSSTTGPDAIAAATRAVVSALPS